MYDLSILLKEYWNSFSIPAYPEKHIPDTATLPYITYEEKQPDWRESAVYYVRIWYEGTSIVPLTKKADEISEDVGEGKMIKSNKTIAWIFKEPTFFQLVDQPEADRHVQCGLLIFNIHVLA